MKHTSGPWKAIGEKSNILITGKFTNGKDTYEMPIAYLQTEENLPASMANAQLISAAPELLEVCKALIRIESLWVPTLKDNTENQEECEARAAAYRKIKYAIQKTEGGTKE